MTFEHICLDDVLAILIYKTPLLIAIENEQYEIINLLLQNPQIDINLVFI